tara:strand:+ start:6821 stop:7273 length:453 start_codon:yes stop_codon:yes gene_type:complete
MGLLAKEYDLSKVILTVGGIPIGGYGSDGGVVVEWVAPIYEVNVGADGLTVASKVNNTDATATITLNEMSAGYAALGGLLKIQENDPTPGLIPIPFLLIDPGNGDTVASAFVIFTDRPSISKARVAGERAFTLHLPGAAITAIYGAANVI